MQISHISKSKEPLAAANGKPLCPFCKKKPLAVTPAGAETCGDLACRVARVKAWGGHPPPRPEKPAPPPAVAAKAAPDFNKPVEPELCPYCDPPRPLLKRGNARTCGGEACRGAHRAATTREWQRNLKGDLVLRDDAGAAYIGWKAGQAPPAPASFKERMAAAKRARGRERSEKGSDYRERLAAPPR